MIALKAKDKKSIGEIKKRTEKSALFLFFVFLFSHHFFNRAEAKTV